jgi:hypothetical protein
MLPMGPPELLLLAGLGVVALGLLMVALVVIIRRPPR